MSRNAPVRTQAERRASTRKEILTAAEKLFADRGFNQASLGDIAQAAGVSKGAVYHHFDSKDDLILALLDEHFEDHIQAAKRIVDEPGPAGAPQRVVEEIPLDRRWNLLYLEFVARAARDRAFARELRKRLRRLRQTSARSVELLLERERISVDLDAEQIALAVASLGNGLAIEALINPGTSTDPIYASALDLMLEGARAKNRR